MKQIIICLALLAVALFTSGPADAKVNFGLPAAVKSAAKKLHGNRNSAPVISSLTANPAIISTGAVTAVTCAALDADGDILAYSWSAASGSISGSGYQVNWTAPLSTGTYSVACEISDAKNTPALKSVNIEVAPYSAHQLPDTGQTQSYTGTFGEDHDYQPAASQPSYTDNADGTTTDNRTGLMWVKDGNSAGCNNGNTLTWDESLNFCEGLTYAGYSDWRLPNVRELESIVNVKVFSPAINAVYFPNTNSSPYYSQHWTSTTLADYPSGDYAWGVYFYRGDMYGYDKSESHYLRCVRAGP